MGAPVGRGPLGGVAEEQLLSGGRLAEAFDAILFGDEVTLGRGGDGDEGGLRVYGRDLIRS